MRYPLSCSVTPAVFGEEKLAALVAFAARGTRAVPEIC